jgi:O-antigen/teichoic acid export membrane protein
MFAKTITGITLVFIGFKINGALSASFVGAMFLFFAYWQRLHKVSELHNERLKKERYLEKFTRITIKVFFIFIPVGFFYELDLLLIKRFLPPEKAGVYAAAALVGKALLTFSSIAGGVIFPRLVEQKFSKKGIFTFLWGIGITVLLFITGYVVLKLLGKPILNLLFGDKYSGVETLVLSYVIALVPLAIHLQITNYKGAIGSWIEGIWLWVVLGAYFTVLEMSSANIDSYLNTIFIFNTVSAPLSFIILFIRHRNTMKNTLL